MTLITYGDSSGEGIARNGAGTAFHFEATGGITTRDTNGNVVDRVDDTSRPIIVKRVPLLVGTAGGGVFSWLNPEAVAILVSKVELDVTTAATAAATVSIGTTTTNGTTSSANLIDTLDVHTAIGVFTNQANGGTNGKTIQKLAAGGWVTGSQASGAIAGIVGFAYIHYHLI